MTIKHGKQNIQLTQSNNGNTLANISANYFVTLSFDDFSVTLPNVAIMAGESLTFTTTNTNYEGGFQLEGPIDASSSSFNLNAPSSVTFLSDGNRWWITSYYSDS